MYLIFIYLCILFISKYIFRYINLLNILYYKNKYCLYKYIKYFML